MKKITVLSICLVTFLSGCGFALRGVSEPLPQRFEKTYVADDLATNNLFQERVKQLITVGGGKLINRDDANVQIKLSEIKVSSRQIALSGNGAVKEYERMYATTVTVTDLKTGIQLGSRQLSTTRNLQLDDRNVLAGEEQSNATKTVAEKALANAVYQYLKTF